MHPSTSIGTATSVTPASRLRTLRERQHAAAERSHLEAAASELSAWLATAPTLGLDEISTMSGVRETLLGALWEARLHGRRAARTEHLVRHVLTGCTPAVLSRHPDLLRDLLVALSPEAREALLAELGPEGSVRRGFVEALTRPASRTARAYTAF